MPTQANPFYNFDPAKMIAALDVETVMVTQRKTMDVLATAGKTVVEGMQKSADRQAKIFHDSFDGMTRSLADLHSLENPAEAFGMQIEVLQTAFEQNVANMTELTDVVVKAGSDAMAAFNEADATAKAPKKKAAAAKPKAKAKAKKVKAEAETPAAAAEAPKAAVEKEATPDAE